METDMAEPTETAIAAMVRACRAELVQDGTTDPVERELRVFRIIRAARKLLATKGGKAEIDAAFGKEN